MHRVGGGIRSSAIISRYSVLSCMESTSDFDRQNQVLLNPKKLRRWTKVDFICSYNCTRKEKLDSVVVETASGEIDYVTAWFNDGHMII